MKTGTVFRIYVSHSIRGPSGVKATDEEIAANIDKFKRIGEEIRAYLIDWEKMCGFPKIDLYVPADHDEFVQIAYKKKYITEEQILDVDCEIINSCSMMISWENPKTTGSRGMQIEFNHAEKKGIPIFTICNLSQTSIRALAYAIDIIISGAQDESI